MNRLEKRKESRKNSKKVEERMGFMEKKLVSFLLVLCLCASLCPSRALAVEQDPASDTPSAFLGEMSLTMHRTAALAATDFSVQLSGQNGETYVHTLHAEKGADKATVSFANIISDTYTLYISASNAYYRLYYQEGLVFDGTERLSFDIYNSVTVNDGRSAEEGLFGVMPVGDLDNSGTIDDTDAETMIQAIEDGDVAYDITGDGVVDIADLSIVVRNQGDAPTATPTRTVSSSLLAATVSVQTEEGTKVAEGSAAPSEMLNQNSETVVQLVPANDAAICPENPVSVTLDVTGTAEGETTLVEADAIVIVPPANAENAITAGVVTIEAQNADGTIETIERSLEETPALNPEQRSESQPAAIVYNALPRAASGEILRDADGTLVIDLGKRVAIKKVTIRITATANAGNLAEIAKVEFLGDFGSRISEPQLSIPTVLSVTNTESDGQGYKNLTITWDPQTNVTNYQIRVSGNGYNKTAATSDTTYTFQGSALEGTVKSFETYTVNVRSCSGDWTSDWSADYTHTVTCKNVPPTPQYVTATSGVESLNITWNCTYDAQWFTLYYKEADAEGAYQAIEDLQGSSYTLRNLKGGVKYTLYMVAHNENGSSDPSNEAEEMPTTPTGVVMPQYKLLNVSDENSAAMTHIVEIRGDRDNSYKDKSYTIYNSDGTTISHTDVKAGDWNVLLDNDPGSYVQIPDWDSGVAYYNFRGPVITLDQKYTMDTIRIAPIENSAGYINKVAIGYKDENDEIKRMSASCSTKYDSLGRQYYELVMDEPVTTNYLEIRTCGSHNHTICEVKLYYYDDLDDCVANLFEDDMRTVLKDTVTAEEIDELAARLDVPDAVSGELHPHRDMIRDDLEYAKQLLEESADAKILTVDNQITARNQPNSGFAQTLSDYQPLGCVAAAGDTIVLYVSGGNVARGQNVNLKLVATQYHPEVANWQGSAIQLHAGRNEIMIPKIGSYAKESGGSLYLQYTGVKGETTDEGEKFGDEYTVRVTGATAIPTLRLDGVTGQKRTDAIAAYVLELEAYVGQLEARHTAIHASSENANVNTYAYSTTECFLNSTEITMENMMFSVPATQVLEGLDSISGESRTERLTKAIEAMEQEIDYFYQFKGLNKDATDNDAYPYTRLNIRYHQMFTGAFMYAGGKHIGIAFESVAGLFTTNPIVLDDNGKKVSGNYSGWGIAHEIGHCINAAAYQKVEVTNNVFAQLAQTEETNESFRTAYESVYKIVASERSGPSVNLAMYWQLHLAYDEDYTYKVYDTIEAQQNGLFYARLESYLRDRTKAEPDLPTDSSGDQLFMQAACAAAGRNLLAFFKAWGYTPDTVTEEYAGKFETETRKIQYVDDDSRLYRIEKTGTGMSEGTAVTASITNAIDRRINGNTVAISLSNNNTNENAMLGYEICRNGKVVAFVPATETSCTDIITTENNKTFVYTVTAIDRLLGETEVTILPEIKVCHDGAIRKDNWVVTTNMTSTQDMEKAVDENNPESGSVNGNSTPAVGKISAIGAALDNDRNTVFYGTGVGGRPYVTLDLGSVEQVTALKFTPAPEDYSGNASAGTNVAAADLYKFRLFGYRVECSTDGVTWTTVKQEDAYTGSANNPDSWVKADDVILNRDGSYTMYFNKQLEDGSMDPYMYTYDAQYVRLTATNMSSLAIAELDVLGPTSDNVELVPEGYGVLSDNYYYTGNTESTEFIPKGAVIFYGEYKGDPSYSVILLKNQDGTILQGQQLFFAEVTANGQLGETGDGRWIFWLENVEKTHEEDGTTYNEFVQLEGLTSVQVELYRVQDAISLQGQRLTSTSLTMTIPDEMPTLSLTSASQINTQNYMAVAPMEEMIRAAQLYEEGFVAAADGEKEAAAEAIESACVADSGNVYYADTGARETIDPVEASPVDLTSGEGFTVNFTVTPQEIVVAAQVCLTMTPMHQESPAVHFTAQPNLFQSYRYNAATGNLTLYLVARSRSMDGAAATGTIGIWMDESSPATTLTASTLMETDSTYKLRKETPLTASATLDPSEPAVKQVALESWTSGDSVVVLQDPARLLADSNVVIIAAQYSSTGQMTAIRKSSSMDPTDPANVTVSFGFPLTGSGWKLFFLTGGTYVPIADPVVLPSA